MSIRVVLGEDNVLVREGVRALLDSYDDIEVVGVAEDAPSLLAAAAEHVPDVVVTDIKMPPSFQLEGIDCAHAIRHDHPDTGVVVLSAHDDEEYAIALLGEGHSGLAYLLKDRIAQGDELARAIREVHAGGSVVDPAIAERLTGSRHADEDDRQILDMMSQGLGYAEMATRAGHHAGGRRSRVTSLFGRMAGNEAAAASTADAMRGCTRRSWSESAEAESLKSFVPSQVADRPRRRRGRAARARGHGPVQRHPRVLHAVGAARRQAGRRRDRTPPPGDGRGRHLARRHDRQVPGRRGHGDLRCARAHARSRRASRRVRVRDAGATGRAQPRRVGDRRGRRARGRDRRSTPARSSPARSVAAAGSSTR